MTDNTTISVERENAALRAELEATRALLSTARTLIDPGKMAWEMDCACKRGWPDKWSREFNEKIRLILSYPPEARYEMLIEVPLLRMHQRDLVEESTMQMIRTNSPRLHEALAHETAKAASIFAAKVAARVAAKAALKAAGRKSGI
jgi:hypothetical protein